MQLLLLMTALIVIFSLDLVREGEIAIRKIPLIDSAIFLFRSYPPPPLSLSLSLSLSSLSLSLSPSLPPPLSPSLPFSLPPPLSPSLFFYSVFIRDCVRCVLMVSCQQFRTRDCKQCVVYLHCTSQPVIEASSEMRFGCFQCHYPELGGEKKL